MLHQVGVSFDVMSSMTRNDRNSLILTGRTAGSFPASELGIPEGISDKLAYRRLMETYCVLCIVLQRPMRDRHVETKTG